jgi:hypothetical protein
MSAHTFVRRHYSQTAGESPTGHAMAVLAGFTLIAIGGGLIASVALVEVGVPIGILGLLMLGTGIVGHIQSPLTFSDVMDTVIGLTGAAIAATFTIAVMVMATLLLVSVLVSVFRWLAN